MPKPKLKGSIQTFDKISANGPLIEEFIIKGPPQTSLKNPYYFLTVFKIANHTTWRANFSGDEQGFEKEKKNWKINSPVVTDLKVYRINRITGEIEVK